MMQNARALAITISELLKEKQRGGGGGVKLPSPLTAPHLGPTTRPLLSNLNRGGR